jgi:hypothetical protein
VRLVHVPRLFKPQVGPQRFQLLEQQIKPRIKVHMVGPLGGRDVRHHRVLRQKRGQLRGELRHRLQLPELPLLVVGDARLDLEILDQVVALARRVVLPLMVFPREVAVVLRREQRRRCLQ